ncbi:MAG: pseudaminic acid synthase [Bacteroidia bacterium]
MNEITIGSRKLGLGCPSFIIGELSGNHNGDYDLAVKTVHAMHAAGVDCLKLQTAKPHSITIDSRKPDFLIKGGTLWDDKSLFELYSEVHTPWEWHEPLQKLAHSLGMEFFSSPFDHEAVEFLEEMNVPAYKIASFEITDIPLIEHAASKGKPMIMSTGIAREADIQEAVDACRRMGNEQIIILKCTSSYPTPLEEVNLNSIALLRERFNVQVGLSDHTLGYIVPIGAVALGATLIEKHFILDRSIGGADAAFSMEPAEFAEMISTIRDIEKAMGKATMELSEKSLKNRDFSRSLYVVDDIAEGEILNNKNIRSIRPGYGMAPKHLNEIIGRKAKLNIEKGTPLSPELFD